MSRTAQLVSWNYEATVEVRDALDHLTEERMDVARVVCRSPSGREIIILASRKDGDWFPTWFGPVGGAEQVPPGMGLSKAILAAIGMADRV